MLKALLEHEHNPKLMIHVSLLEAAFDEATKTETLMIDASKLAKMMKGAGNDG